MSVIRKTPFIETAISLLSETLKDRLSVVLNSNDGSNRNSSFADMPAANTVTPVYFKLDETNYKNGILIYQNNNNCVLIAYHRFQDLLIYKLDPVAKLYTKINEYLDINELRRVLNDRLGKSIEPGEIDSTGAAAGDSLLADGNGGTEWGKPTGLANNAAEGDILISDGDGGTQWVAPREIESDEHIVTFDGVTFVDNEVNLPLSSGDARWTYMQDTTVDCVLVLRLTSGIQVEMRRIHYDTDYVEFGCSLNQEVDGNGKYMTITYSAKFASTGGKAVYTELEANKGGLDGDAPYLSDLTVGGESYHVVDKEQLDEKANVDGNYPTMTVGVADGAKDIISDREIEDASDACPPIVFGSTGGSAEIQSGYNKLEELRGNTVVFNQLNAYRGNQTVFGLTLTNNGDGTINLTGTCTETPSFNQYSVGQNIIFKRDGITKYLIVANQTLDIGITGYPSAVRDHFFFQRTEGTSWTGSVYIYVNQGQEYNIQNFSINVFNLTQMFGAGKEPETVEDFRKLFPKPYYEYNEGTLLSSQSTSLISRGRNQFDLNAERTETYGTATIDGTKITVTGTYYCSWDIMLMPQTYFVGWDAISGSFNQLRFVYEDGSLSNYLVRNSTITTTKWVTKILLYCGGGTTATCVYDNVQVYINWDTPNLPYVPYQAQTVNLPNIELRSAGSVYDVLYQAGGGKRRIGVVDLGTLNWSYNTSSTNPRFIASLPLRKLANRNVLCSKYITVGWDAILGTAVVDKVIGGDYYSVYIGIIDSAYTDAATFKSAMSGVMLYYELATETDIDDNPGWDELLYVDNFGTLEFTSEQNIQVPQAYYIKYTVNLVEFLDSVYVKADGNADNLVTKEELTLVDNKIGVKLPECPTTTDGTYTLKSTVADGTVVYEWVLEA